MRVLQILLHETTSCLVKIAQMNYKVGPLVSGVGICGIEHPRMLNARLKGPPSCVQVAF